MFGLGLPELLLIFLIVLVVFGASKLPQIGEGLGKGIKNFKKAVQEGEQGDTAKDSKEDTAKRDEE